MSESLQGFIERVTFHNPENGFAVLRVKVPGRDAPVTVVGNATSVTAGEHVEATGHWTVDRQHGQQFKAEAMKTTHPASAEGIGKYLAAGAIRSIGPKLAARIVGIYGEKTLEVFDNSPDFLLHVKGIGTERLRRIRQSWQEQKEVRKIMLFLSEHGITPGRAVRIYRTYGQQSIAKIKSNPYQLADDIRGIGFKTADELAGRIGIDRNSPYRARAAIQYTLQDLAAKGHCGYPEAAAVDHAVKLVAIERTIIEEAIQEVIREGNVVRERVDGESWLYLASLHRAEIGLAAAVHRLLAADHPLPHIEIAKALAWVEQRLGIELAAGQQEAIRQACQQKVLIITGGPGVGKTTLVRSLLEIFSAKQLKCVLAAPTGRAAKRLSETTGQTAKTLHRLLEYEPASGEFKRNQQRPLAGDLFVLDETSMLDLMLGYQTLRAIPTAACLILVGDVDQLPSVGPGSVLADLIASNIVPVVRLTEIFRQAGDGGIVSFANSINRGQIPNLPISQELSDIYFVEADDPDAIQKMLVKLIKDRIPTRFGLDAATEIQVLSPMNRAQLGARNLNQVLQSELNPGDQGPEIQRFGWTFRIGDRVIQNENNYDRDTYNGDLGIIEKINRIEQEMVVNFDGRSVAYDFGDLDEISLAYVLSIHKSQGSEFPCVVIPLHTQHYLMLQRNLLYTAVTRGKRLVVVVGSKKALAMAIQREDTSHRNTALKRRLQAVRGTS